MLAQKMSTSVVLGDLTLFWTRGYLPLGRTGQAPTMVSPLDSGCSRCESRLPLSCSPANHCDHRSISQAGAQGYCACEPRLNPLRKAREAMLQPQCEGHGQGGAASAWSSKALGPSRWGAGRQDGSGLSTPTPPGVLTPPPAGQELLHPAPP